MKQLDYISLGDSKFKAEWMKHMAALPKLKGLDLGNTPFDDAAASHIAKIKTLVVLTAGRTKLGDKGLELLIKQPKLESIDINDTKVTKATFQKRLLQNLLPRLMKLIIQMKCKDIQWEQQGRNYIKII